MSRKYSKPQDVPTEVLAARLDELVRVITSPRMDRDWSEFYMRIPAEADHDADIVLSEAARRLRATIPAPEKKVNCEFCDAGVGL